MRFLFALLATFALGCTGSRPTPTDDPIVANGARLYRTYCGLCHGDRGEGYAADAASALTHPEFLRSATDDFIKHAITRGRPGTAMASYARRQGGPLSDEEIDAIVRFLRSRSRSPALVRDGYVARAGNVDARPIYERECAACHGERGQGSTALSLANPTFLESADDTFLRHAIAKGRRRTPMPAFEGRLSPAEIDALVAYVRSFTRSSETPTPPTPTPPEGETPIPDDLPLIIHPDGPAPRFTLREGRYVSSAQVARALADGKRMIILDARSPADWVLMRIPGAVPAPYYAVEDLAERIPADGTFVIAYCACPHAASGRVVDTLRERGFANTAVLDEGVLVWRQLGHPVEGTSVEE